MSYFVQLAPRRPWRIFRQRGVMSVLVGVVEARDEKEAIREAIERFHITNPEHQKWLRAEREGT